MSTQRTVKPGLFFLYLSPMLWIIWNAVYGDLGANPVESVTHQTGDWALRLLILTLAITPLRRLTGYSPIIRYRRMTGLFTYFYASCHFLIWFLADQSLDFIAMFDDVIKRPYISMGFLAFVLLTALAITSNKWSIRKLGNQWRVLHRLIYVIILIVILHYLWLVKANYLEPLVYAFIASILLLLRLHWGGSKA